MTFNGLTFKPLCAAVLASLLTACGGGGGGSDGDTLAGNGGGNTSGGGTGGSSVLVMSCPEGPGYQCSGDTIIDTENGVAYSASGVQVYGRSTSDQFTPVVNPTTPTGFELASGELASGGLAEFRVAKDANSNITSPVILLRNLGISWDGVNQRPIIIEPFLETAGRSVLRANGTIDTGVALPPPSDTSFYNFETLGAQANQLSYANNRYFPRAEPSRCGPGVVTCPTIETRGVQIRNGDWRTGGTMPDVAEATRLHEDGDVHAGDGAPNGTGPGVPFPGGKGYRSFTQWSYANANLGTWVSSDTIDIVEWRPNQPVIERAQARRGVVAYGDVTAPASVPTTGSATYVGKVYGWYSPASNGGEPDFISADALVTVDFATRQTTVRVENAGTYTATPVAVPVNFVATTLLGNGGRANYFTGAAVSGTLNGGVSGRLFGPVDGAAPNEIGGAISLSNPAGATVVGGFIGQRQP